MTQRICNFEDHIAGLRNPDRRCGAAFDTDYYSLICPHDGVNADVIPCEDAQDRVPMTQEEWDTHEAAIKADFGDVVNLREDGILWMINRTIFHPRGFALAINEEVSQLTLTGDGVEVWTFAESMADIEQELFDAFEGMLYRRMTNAAMMKDHKAAAIAAEQEPQQ